MSVRDFFRWWGELEWRGIIPAWMCTHFYLTAREQGLAYWGETECAFAGNVTIWVCTNPKCTYKEYPAIPVKSMLQVWNRVLGKRELRQAMRFPGSVKNGLTIFMPLFGMKKGDKV